MGPESDAVANAHKIVKETTEARLKFYIPQKNLGCHILKLEGGAFMFVKKKVFEREI